MDLGGGFHCASQKTREHFYFILTGQLRSDQSQSSSVNHKLNYRCCLLASHDPYVMEIFGNRFVQTDGRLFFSSRLSAIMPLNLKAVFPCSAKKEVRSTEKRSIDHRSKPSYFPFNVNCFFFLSVSLFCNTYSFTV